MTIMLEPVLFDAPLVNPSPGGLYAATHWDDSGGTPRWLAAGMEIRPWNFGLDDAFGVWGASWCASPEDLTEADVKVGTRPVGLDSFAAITIWSADQCDPTAPSRDEVRTRAAQALRMQEQTAVELEFAARMLADAGTPEPVPDLVAALSVLDDAFGLANVTGYIHARPGWIAAAAQQNLLVRNGSTLKTPAGHQWVFGGGYVDGLESTLVATSQPFGWRTEVALRTALEPETSTYAAIAERSVLVGYEALVAAVEVVAADDAG